MEQEHQSTNVDDIDNAISTSIEGPSQCTSSGKKLTSSVWEHMTKLPSADKGRSKARCNFCKKELVASAKSGTSHLHRHLESCPMRNFRDIKNFCISSGGSSSFGTNNQLSLRKALPSFDEIRAALCLFIVSSGLPFSIVEHPGFRHLMNVVVPDFSLVSRHTIKRDAIVHYKEDKKLVGLELLNAPGRICFTTDNWRSENTDDEFMCITSHWIDSAWNLQKRIIKFAALTPPFDGASLADEILLSLGEWKISHKVFTLTLDNASYNDTMIASLKSHLLRKHSLILDGEFFHMRCCCHIINLVVQAGLKLIDEVVLKIRKIIIHLRHSIPKNKKFYEIASTNFGLNTIKRLRLDTPTRWNSTFIMLDRVIYFRDAIDSFVSKDMDLKVHRLSEEDWDKVVEIHGFLKTFYDVTNDFSASKTPTANIYFYGVWKLHVALNNIAEGPPCLLSMMVHEMQKKFEKYWSDYNLLLSCAAVLDPRFKLAAINFCYAKLFGDIYAKEMVEKVKNTLFELIEEYKGFVGSLESRENSEAHGNKSAPLSTRHKRVAFDVPGEELMDFLTKKNRTNDKSELEAYLEEENENARDELDILQFWKKKSDRSPALAAMARDILTIPISSVPSESAFSLGKKMITSCRSSLASSTIEALACYEDWLRMKGFGLGTSKMLKIGVDASDEVEDEDESDKMEQT